MLAEFTYRQIPLYELGPLTLSLHGVFAALGFLAGSWLAVELAARRGFDRDAYLSMFNWALVGALLGARYFTIGAQISEGASFAEVISPLGNFSILGGMLGGILGAAIRAKRLNQPWWALVDTASYGLAVGTIVGRIGDLAIAEHLGAATDFFLGYAVKSGYDLAPQHTALECGTLGQIVPEITCGVYHPTWLYDLLGALVLLGVLAWINRIWKDRHYGQLFSVWVIWYGAQRFLIDFTRQVPVDQGIEASRSADALLGPFTWSQWSALGMIVVGFVLIRLQARSQMVITPEHDAQLAAAAGKPLRDDAPVV